MLPARGALISNASGPRRVRYVDPVIRIAEFVEPPQEHLARLLVQVGAQEAVSTLPGAWARRRAGPTQR